MLGKDYRPLGGPVGEEWSLWRVDDYLAKHFRFLSRSAWQKRIKNGEVRLNGGQVKVSQRIRLGDTLHYYHPQGREPAVTAKLPVVWQSQQTMVIAKPPGMPMHENGPYRFNTVAHQLIQQYGAGWAAVHRLDRETSGLVLCANTHQARESLHRQFETKTIAKTYLAVVKGEPTWDRETVEAPIDDLVGSEIRIKKWVVPGGQSALTHFTKVAGCGDHTWVLARPVTGRTNQIRIHAAWLGYPLLGDKLYHPSERVFLEYYDRGMTDWVRQQAGFDRVCLHAWRVAFCDPESSNLVEVTAPIPEDLKSLAPLPQPGGPAVDFGEGGGHPSQQRI